MSNLFNNPCLSEDAHTRFRWSDYLKTGCWLLLFLILSEFSYGQCTSVISSFPYNEGFESGPAWTSGVVAGADNWAWGTPAHPTINSAGSGIKAWCVGGLTGSNYFSSAQCYLLSPCFDFSTLDHPWISFKIFWECERQWDGMVLQYSFNGTTWTNVGAYNDPVDCNNQNWYNYNNITWLNTITVKHGWSGRVGATSGSCTGGFGSNGWVTATHCMPNLAHQSDVRFRFLFGSGTSCNAYDGLALDDVIIQEAPAINADFSFSCTGQNAIAFTNLSGICASNFQWDFGEPSSGVSNTSTLQNPSHNYSGPGSYNVTLIASGSCSAPTSITVPVILNNVTLNATDVSCYSAGDGSIEVVTSGGGPYTYLWSPNVGTGSIITNLSPGTYSVTVTASGGCPVNASAIIAEPSQLVVNAVAAPSVVCSGGQVTLSGTATGGTANYSYVWDPGFASGSTLVLSPTASGTYTVEVTDQNGCTASAAATFTLSPDVQVLADADITSGCAPICINFSDQSTVQSPGGLTNWFWDFGDGGFSTQQNPFHCFGSEGSYPVTLTVTNTDGCASSLGNPLNVTAWHTPQALFSYTPSTPDITNPEVIFINLSAGSDYWIWSFGDANSSLSNVENPMFIYSDTGTFIVNLIAISDAGCSDTVSQPVCILPMLTFYVPNSFTPNGDGVNDFFAPVSMGVMPEGFMMTIVDRWGYSVFYSDSPAKAWDGRDLNTNSDMQMGIYAWLITYKDHDGKLQTRLGTVMLVR